MGSQKPSETARKVCKTCVIMKNKQKLFYINLFILYFHTVHSYDVCYYRKCLKFLPDALKHALDRNCANRRTFLSITRFKTQGLKYILLEARILPAKSSNDETGVS